MRVMSMHTARRSTVNSISCSLRRSHPTPVHLFGRGHAVQAGARHRDGRDVVGESGGGPGVLRFIETNEKRCRENVARARGVNLRPWQGGKMLGVLTVHKDGAAAHAL